MPDINLEMGKDKMLMIILLIYTFIIDLIWLFYWKGFWRSDVMKDWERGIHNFVIIMSIVGIFYKVSPVAVLTFQLDLLYPVVHHC